MDISNSGCVTDKKLRAGKFTNESDELDTIYRSQISAYKSVTKVA
jgi:hypothetical protein